MFTNEKLASELDKVAEICTSTALSEAAKRGAELIRGEGGWSSMDDSPDDMMVEVAIKEFRFCTVIVAWKHNGTWISDNVIVHGEVYAWRPLPEAPDYKQFAK